MRPAENRFELGHELRHTLRESASEATSSFMRWILLLQRSSGRQLMRCGLQRQHEDSSKYSARPVQG
jgi:hypothetical protein